MKLQNVSKYIVLSEEGLVPKLVCPMDQGLLFPNLDKEDNLYMYCISCDYKNFVGIKFYEAVLKELERVESKND